MIHSNSLDLSILSFYDSDDSFMGIHNVLPESSFAQLAD